VRFTGRIGALAAVLALALAAPAAAQSGTSGSQSTGSSGTGTATAPTGSVPSRVESRLARADRSLQRAEDAIDDGDNAKGVTALKSVQRNLSAAERAAKRYATGTNGPAAFAAVEDATHSAVGDLVDLFDGVTDSDTVNQIGATLKSALDGRDDLVAALGALSADQKAGYGSVAGSISSDVADEIAGVQDALANDALKDPEAKDALNAALTQLQASASAASALGISSSTSGTATGTGTGTTAPTAGTPSGRGHNGDCPNGQTGGGSSSSSSGTQPTTAGPAGSGGGSA
jgi:hypothetical protein